MSWPCCCNALMSCQFIRDLSTFSDPLFTKLQTVKKLPLYPYLSKTGLANVNWLFGESSKASIITLLLLNSFFNCGIIILTVPKLIWNVKNIEIAKSIIKIENNLKIILLILFSQFKTQFMMEYHNNLLLSTDCVWLFFLGKIVNLILLLDSKNKKEINN